MGVPGLHICPAGVHYKAATTGVGVKVDKAEQLLPSIVHSTAQATFYSDGQGRGLYAGFYTLS